MIFETPTTSPIPIVYLPGALGRSSFWRPVADRLWHIGAPIVLGYPGFGDVPTHPEIGSLADLYDFLLSILPPRFMLVGQSMGNVLALRMAIEHPDRIEKLVLCAVTGGIDVQAHGGEQWRVDLTAEQPSLPNWFVDDRSDFTGQLAEIRIPTLILSGTADPLSPVPVGEFLRNRLPSAELHVLPNGTHSMAYDAPDRVAAVILEFLTNIP